MAWYFYYIKIILSLYFLLNYIIIRASDSHLLISSNGVQVYKYGDRKGIGNESNLGQLC